VPVVIGPTGVGKTEIVLRALNGEDAQIVSADSRQIYSFMDIGTAKPTLEQRECVTHHLVDCVDPEESLNAAQYARQARKVISDLLDQDKTSVVVGGSGLHLRALLEGFFEGPGADPGIRRKLAEEENNGGPGTLHQRLTLVDPESAERIHPHDRVRTIRALEVHSLTGMTISQLHQRGRYKRPQFRYCKMGFYRPREELYGRIDRRVELMIGQGLVDETRELLARGYSPELRSMSTLGYRETIEHLQGRIDLDETVSRIKRNTRQYAKRQMTWFGKEEDILWFQAEQEEKHFLQTLRNLRAGRMPAQDELAESRERQVRCWSSVSAT